MYFALPALCKLSLCEGREVRNRRLKRMRYMNQFCTDLKKSSPEVLNTADAASPYTDNFVFKFIVSQCSGKISMNDIYRGSGFSQRNRYLCQEFSAT
jgi:hypothetical protein